MTNEIKFIFDRLFAFYKVATITELARCLGMSQPAVTNWQRRNSISAIKKKCRELGIYDEIFKDLNYTLDDFDFSDFDKIKKLKQQCKKYNIITTSINNQKMLKLLEDIFTVADRDIKEEQLEKDLIDLFFKYNPNLDRNTFPMNDFLKPNNTTIQEKDTFLEKFQKRVNWLKKQKEIGSIDDEELDDRLFELGRDFNREIEKQRTRVEENKKKIHKSY